MTRNSKQFVPVGSRSIPLQGFTLLELLIAIAIAGLLMSTTIPAMTRFYQSMQYRQAVRDVVTTLGTARHQAINSGKAQDVGINPRSNVMRLNDKDTAIPEDLSIAVHSAAEVNREDEGVIRFYPEGGSSGGDIDLERPDGSGVTISVDWLVGRVSQEAYDID